MKEGFASDRWFVFVKSLGCVVLFLLGSTNFAHSQYIEGAEKQIGLDGHVADLSTGLDETLHVITSSLSDGYVWHVAYGLGGWNTSEKIPGSNSYGWQFGRGRGTVDVAGNMHVVWGSSSNRVIYYSKRKQTGWSPVSTLHEAATGPACSRPTVATTLNGHVHVLFETNFGATWGLSHKEYDPQDGWLSSVKITSGSYGFGQPFLVSWQNNLHAVTLSNANGPVEAYYMTSSPSGWTTPSSIMGTAGAGSAYLQVEETGLLLLTWTRYANDGNWFVEGVYGVERTNGNWETPTKINSSAVMSEEFGPLVTHAAQNEKKDMAFVWCEAGRVRYSIKDSNGNWILTEKILSSLGTVHERAHVKAIGDTFHLVWKDERGGFWHNTLTPGQPPFQQDAGVSGDLTLDSGGSFQPDVGSIQDDLGNLQDIGVPSLDAGIGGPKDFATDSRRRLGLDRQIKLFSMSDYANAKVVYGGCSYVAKNLVPINPEWMFPILLVLWMLRRKWNFFA